ncbi:MAG TPA: ribosome maturation factor RimM [Bacteriovoracaceae bacterium]|nr:ribosome maturation factor RimM [Bacteriovoracaceae bacterium]
MAKELLKIIKIAFVARPFGIKGEAELGFLSDNVLEENMQVLATPYNERSSIPKEGMKLTFEKIKYGNKVVATFKEIKDRNHLESLIPFEISVYRENLVQGELYSFDLPGLDVVSETGEKLGEVSKVLDNGAQEVLEIKLLNGETVMLPFVENFFPEINLEERSIVMISPEYSE